MSDEEANLWPVLLSEIVGDTLSDPHVSPALFSVVAALTVALCENPWDRDLLTTLHGTLIQVLADRLVCLPATVYDPDADKAEARRSGASRPSHRGDWGDVANIPESLPSQTGSESGTAVRFVVGGRVMNPGYPIAVFWSDEDSVWIADAPDLPMCSAHGLVPHEAVAEIEQAIEAWLDAARATGRPIPKPSSRAALA